MISDGRGTGSYPWSFEMTGRGLEVLPLSRKHVGEGAWLYRALAATNGHLTMPGTGPDALPLGFERVDNLQRAGCHALSQTANGWEMSW